MIRQTGSVPAGLTPENVRQKLHRRATILAAIRQYFCQQDVLEVETPLLHSYGVTDPQLENIRAEKPFSPGEWLYLQTSPEYSLKHLLALGSGSIYQLSKAFRNDPVGRLHSHEFSLLEWYRIDFSLDQLMDDVSSLLQHLILKRSVRKITYRHAFCQYANIDPFQATDQELMTLARALVDIDAKDEDRDFWLDLILTHAVEPKLGQGELTFLTHYPASQAALAKITSDNAGFDVAERFELYIDGVEMANGYHELTDAAAYRSRFEQDNFKRQQRGLIPVAIDECFLDAIKSGLPACSGVAMGVDRLLLITSET